MTPRVHFAARIAALAAILGVAPACAIDLVVGHNGGGEGGAGGHPIGGDGGHPGPPPGGGGIDVFGTTCPEVGLRSVRALPNVAGRVVGSNVRVHFDPQGDAADYRIFELPKEADVAGDKVTGATYRCAGGNEVPIAPREDEDIPNAFVRTRVESEVAGYARTESDATLGHVFTSPGKGRIPVYALGSSATDADNADCYAMRWPESRLKVFTTSDADKAKLLEERYRDDGIAFYVPEPGTAGTRSVHQAAVEMPASAMLYFADGTEQQARDAAGVVSKKAFSVYKTPQTGSEPLMRVYYAHACARSHDELVAGQARYEKARDQGMKPVPELHFSGLSGPTTLVLEAVDRVCPFRGLLAPVSRPPNTLDGIDYPALLTPDELRDESADGELYVNGQGDEGVPRAVARTCLEVSPVEPPAADFRYVAKGSAFDDGTPHEFQNVALSNATLDADFRAITTDEWTLGDLFGELWTMWGDFAGVSTDGALRVTSKGQRGRISADAFLHVTMEVDAFATDRRHPQVLITDQAFPATNVPSTGKVILVQPGGGVSSPLVLELRFCEAKGDEDSECVFSDLYRLQTDVDFLSPQPEFNGLTGLDRTVFFDVYASTNQVYVFLNELPAGCGILPWKAFPEGPATVYFGEMLQGSTNDPDGGDPFLAWFPFHQSRMRNLTSRHFSNLSYSSDEARPPWDDDRFPCAPMLPPP